MNAVSPEGNRIIGTLETVEGTARAEVELADSGRLDVEYSGETEVDWNTQQTKTEEGERLFVCSEHKVWRENQVILATRSKTARCESPSVG